MIIIRCDVIFFFFFAAGNWWRYLVARLGIFPSLATRYRHQCSRQVDLRFISLRIYGVARGFGLCEETQLNLTKLTYWHSLDLCINRLPARRKFLVIVGTSWNCSIQSLNWARLIRIPANLQLRIYLNSLFCSLFDGLQKRSFNVKVFIVLSLQLASPLTQWKNLNFLDLIYEEQRKVLLRK